MKSLAWVTAALGLWLVLAPWALSYDSAIGRTEDLTLGFLVTSVSLRIAVAPRTSPFAAWTALLLAIWVFLAPLLLGYAWRDAAFTNDLIVGAVLVASSLGLSTRPDSPVSPPRAAPAPRDAAEPGESVAEDHSYARLHRAGPNVRR